MEGVTPPYGHQGLTCVNSKQRTLTTISHNSKPELNRSYPAPAWDGGNVYLCFPNIEYPICYGVLVVFMDVWRLWQDFITTGQKYWVNCPNTVYTPAHIDSGFLTVTVAPVDLPSSSQLFLISSFPWPGQQDTPQSTHSDSIIAQKPPRTFSQPEYQSQSLSQPDGVINKLPTRLEVSPVAPRLAWTCSTLTHGGGPEPLGRLQSALIDSRHCQCLYTKLGLFTLLSHTSTKAELGWHYVPPSQSDRRWEERFAWLQYFHSREKGYHDSRVCPEDLWSSLELTRGVELCLKELDWGS